MKRIPLGALLSAGLALSIGILLSCSGDNPAAVDNTQKIHRATLSGKVVDKTGMGLEGVAVTSVPGGYSTFSGAGGNFTLPDIEAGTYQFKFLKVDYIDSTTGDITFGLAESKTLPDVKLLYRYAKVSGKIVDGANQPLIAAGVVVEKQGVSTLSYSGGDFVLNRVEPGTVKILFAKDPLCGTGEFTFFPDSEFNLQVIADQAGGTFVGRVVEGGTLGKGLNKSSAAAASPIANAFVSALAGVLADTTDSAGLFQLNHIPAGAEILLTVVLPSGDTMYLGGLTVTEGGVTDLDTIAVQNSVTQNGIKLVAYEARAFDNEPSVMLLAFATVVDSGKIAGFVWDLDGDGAFETATPTGRLDLAVDSAGTRHVSVKAFDATGRASGTLALTVRIAPFTIADARLSTLALSAGKLSPLFKPGVFQYADTLPAGVKFITFVTNPTQPGATVTLNGDTLPAGAFSDPYGIGTGDSLFTIHVVSEDGTAQSFYQITVVRPSGTVATLSSISLSAGTLSPAFSPSVTLYSDTVAYTVDSIAVSGLPTDSAATVAVTGGALAVGQNLVTVQVTAEDGSTRQTYTVNIIRRPSAAAALSGLTVSAGTLTPAFNASTLLYADSVAGTLSSITLTPTAADTNAVVTVNGDTVRSGTASKTQSLAPGNNTLSVRVTAQDGITKTDYVIVVHRPGNDASLGALAIAGAALTPAFSPSVFAYSVSNFTQDTARVTLALSDTNAAATVNGVSAPGAVQVPLFYGGNILSIIATAQDGATRETTTISLFLDNRPPLITFTAPSGDTIVADSTLSAAGAVTDTTPVTVVWFGTPVTDSPAVALTGTAFTLPAALLAAGANRVVVRAVDAAGNSAQETLTVVRDTAPPAVVISVPSRDTLVNSKPFVLSGRVTDDVEIATARYLLEGVTKKGEVPFPVYSPATGNWQIVETFLEGATQVIVRATDRVGRSVADTVTISADYRKPGVVITYPMNVSLYPNRRFITNRSFINVFAATSDSGDGTPAYQVLGAAPSSGQFNNTEATSWEALNVALAPGDNVFLLSARDSAGNDSVLVLNVSVRPELVFVDAGSFGYDDGSSWDDAFKDLNRALDSAQAWGADSVWVASGHYVPASFGPPSSLFDLFPGAVVLGGFNRGDSLASQRAAFDPFNPASFPLCTLSGDLNFDLAPQGNAYHVVRGADSSVLDGFMIIRGVATGAGSDGRGGGLLNEAVSPTVVRCLFQENTGDTGGAVYNGGTFAQSVAPVFQHCRFYLNGNGFTTYNGGGAYNVYSAALFDSCVFDSNQATSYGGGSFGVNSSAVFDGCLFQRNECNYGGGGLNHGFGRVDLFNSVFSGNRSLLAEGGAVYVQYDTSTVSNTLFTGNRSQYCSGGMYIGYQSQVNFTGANNIFRGNQGQGVGYCYTGGAAIFRADSTADFTGTPDADSTNTPLPAIYP